MAAGGLLRRLADVWAPLWQIEGHVPLPPGMAPATALGRLAELLQAPGTSHQLTGDTLAFRKRDPAAQDRLAVFNAGTLTVLTGEGFTAEGGPVLRYHLVSRALLFCCLLPLLFLGLSQAAVHFEKPEGPPAKAEKAGKAGQAKPPEKAHELHWIDKALGAPAPEAKDKKKDKDKDKEKGKKKKPTPYTGFTFAGIFVALYIIGRVLEAWLVQRLFTRVLWDAAGPAAGLTHPPS